jgi:hypothetical protein
MPCMKPNMRWLDKVKSTLQPDEPKNQHISTMRILEITEAIRNGSLHFRLFSSPGFGKTIPE